MSVAIAEATHRLTRADVPRKQSQIPLIAGDGQLMPGDTFSQVLASSAPGAWPDLVVEQHHCPATELHELSYRQNVLVLNIGHPLVCEHKHNGRWKSTKKSPGAVSLFPSGHTFSRRMQTDADVVYLALEPTIFVRNENEQMATPEFREQRHDSDPVLLHFARTLRQAACSELRHDLLFGSSMALSLARHLLVNYSTQSAPTIVDTKSALAPLALKEAKEFIEAHLQTGMTVEQIASSVRISTSHFTRLFKNATGRSPYRFVMERRMLKAREMLVKNRCSLKEVTYSLGFADQSHLTREFRRTFGITPKLLLEQTTSIREPVFPRDQELVAPAVRDDCQPASPDPSKN